MYGNEGEGVRVPDGPYLRHTQMQMPIPAAEVGKVYAVWSQVHVSLKWRGFHRDLEKAVRQESKRDEW